MISEYRRSMQKTELLLWEETVTEGAGFYEKMFLYNRIPGVLPFVAEQEGERVQYCYDIGAKQSLAEWLVHNKINHEQMEWLIRKIIEVIDGGRVFLIDERDYVISPEFIFQSGDGKQLFLCCYPWLNKDLRQQLTGLFEYMLSRIDYQDIAAVGMAYELYMKCKETPCGFADLLKVLGSYTENEDDLVLLGEQEVMPAAEMETETERTGAYPDEEVEQNTQRAEEAGYCLKRELSQEQIQMIQFPLFIGQREEGTIGRIEYPMIGSTYAKISMRGAFVYIEDMKSESGVFVNGRRIAGNEIHKLNLGDSVMLADRSYRFVRIS